LRLFSRRVRVELASVKQTRERAWIVTLAGAVAVSLYLAHVYYYWPQINDDAFITFRYSKFLAGGGGPYFNHGEHVEGYTNFLLMALTAGVIALCGDDAALPVAKVIGAVAGLASLLGAWALCKLWLGRIVQVSVGAGLLSWTAGALVAINSAFALNSTTGLETTLFSTCVVFGLVLITRTDETGRWHGAGVLFALAALTRPEGAIVFGVVVIGQLLTGAWRDRAVRRAMMWDILLVGGVVAAHLCFRAVFYEGELLPNTYYAKAGGMGGRTASGYLAAFAGRHFAWVLWPLAFIAATLGAAAIKRSVLPATCVLVFAIGAIYATGPDWMPGYRLLVPYVPIWSALAVCGIAVVSGRGRRGSSLPSRAWVPGMAAAAIVVILAVSQTPARRSYHERCVIRAAGYAQGHVALADWLRRDAKSGQTVALMDIGIVGFKCVDLNILDITGLTDRTVAKSPGGFLEKEFSPEYVFDRKPEYLVIIMTAPLLPDGTDDIENLTPWTLIESRLVQTEAFAQHYFRPRRVNPECDELTRFAALLGAERVFRHTYPDYTYLLAAYRSQDVETVRLQP